MWGGNHPLITSLYTLFTGGKDGIINPMVNNMAPAYEKAQYEYVWISTSRIRGKFEMLGEVEDAGYYHFLPFP